MRHLQVETSSAGGVHLNEHLQHVKMVRSLHKDNVIRRKLGGVLRTSINHLRWREQEWDVPHQRNWTVVEFVPFSL